MLVTLADIQHAQRCIENIAHRTPLIPAGAGLWLKPESLQPIGSFKIRGAYNALAAEDHPQAVIAYSSGNHAQGVAYAAQKLGVPAVIVMPKNAATVKVEATRSFGAEVIFYDPATENRDEVAQRLVNERNGVLIPPFNHPKVMAGQGTIGLEIFEDLPDVDLVMTPVGGGGLVSGVAIALKTLKPSVKVIGVEPELAADAQASLRTGKIVALTAAEVGRTIADGVRSLSVGDITFPHMQQYVDDIITVTEDEIFAAVRQLLLQHKLLIEPAGVLPYAAFCFHRAELPPAKNTVLVLTGGNIDEAVLRKALE